MFDDVFDGVFDGVFDDVFDDAFDDAFDDVFDDAFAFAGLTQSFFLLIFVESVVGVAATALFVDNDRHRGIFDLLRVGENNSCCSFSHCSCWS